MLTADRVAAWLVTVTAILVGDACLQSEHLSPSGSVPWQATLLQEVQALCHDHQLRLPGSASCNEDAIHQEGVDEVLRHCGLQVQQGILHTSALGSAA